jgi:type IV pilus assembly protein PilY1
VLPGGPGGTPVTTGPGCPAGGRTFGDLSLDPDYPPRAQVHCYTFPNDESGARSLTIVRLDTGEIIRTFRLSKTEVSSELQARVTEANLDAPITGQPVAYPGFVGQVADRIYVGDADGRLFKVDVSAADPSLWTMKLFFDLYPSTVKSRATGNGYDAGQPVMLPPAVSVDDNGNVVVDVAAGVQEVLGSGQSLTGVLTSLTDLVNPALSASSTKVNWYTTFANGERVVGPMVLFSQWLYYATYRPPDPTAAECSNGTSFVWQSSYLDPKDKTDTSLGPLVNIQLDQFNAVTAGVAGVQEPTCSAISDDVGDALLGLGHQISLTQINTGSFKLVYHTGNLKQSSDTSNASVGVGQVTLTPPTSVSSIQSWASITE